MAIIATSRKNASRAAENVLRKVDQSSVADHASWTELREVADLAGTSDLGEQSAGQNSPDNRLPDDSVGADDPQAGSIAATEGRS